MKLRNKKTGEIVENIWWDKEVDELCLCGNHLSFYGSLAELNEDWEDYEEPEEVWYTDFQGVVRSASREENEWFKENEIGNCFGSREEAEKAVEKLKAWKRLKDKNFRFYGWDKGSLLKSKPNTIEFACDDTKLWSWEDIQDDLDLLFGGEE